MIKAKKSLGQNFLVDKNILKDITELVNIENKTILEIGPGTGNLTSYILDKKPKKIYVVEKDNLLVICLLYTSDAADDLLCVDLGGRRIIKKNSCNFF